MEQGLWKHWPTAALLAVSAIALATSAAGTPQGVAAARVSELARILPARPRGVGPTIEERAPWRRARAHPAFAGAIARARALLKKPIPNLSDELYLDYSRTGNRTRWQRVARQRHQRVAQLVLAECLENRGRFLPAIEEALRVVCAEKSWVMPAHDRGMQCFAGKVQLVDLMVAGESWNLATAAYWLGERLDPGVREMLRAELERRTFTPFESSVRAGRPAHWWLKGTNNWNAVCLAGVCGAALAAIESSERRAFFAAAAEKYVQNFLRGFSPGGYCSEGLGYWNYGFGHFALLAETLRQASGGKLDLLSGEAIARIARFPRRLRLHEGIYPAFADCRPDQQPDPALCAFLSRRLGFGWKAFEERGLGLAVGATTQLPRLGLFGFADLNAAPPAATSSPQPQPLRTWFPAAQILICRPGAEGDDALAVALKGGHNGEHHNHNDVGSFVVALGGATPLVDPGGEIYTRRTFSSKRYESQVLSSFGHSVPRVAGELQRSGRRCAARVLRTEFTPQRDVIALDLAPAYGLAALRRLVRTFTFSRAGRASLQVRDEVQFAGAQPFESALVTFSPWRRLGPDRLLIGKGAGSVELRIQAAGAAFEVRAEEIHEDLPRGRIPVRIAIALKQPVRRGTLTLTITPASGV